MRLKINGWKDAWKNPCNRHIRYYSRFDGKYFAKSSESFRPSKDWRGRWDYPLLLIYELACFWRKTGLVFKNLAEVEEFLKTYFKIAELTPVLAIEASGVKAEGDSILSKSDDSSLSSRRLSVADAVTLTIAMKLGGLRLSRGTRI